VAGTALGLLISALARTEEVAAALVPIAVIPQIILAGVIAPLSGLGKLLANGFITARWGERALEALLPDDYLDWLRLDRPDYPWQVAVVTAHVVVFAGVAILALWRRGQSKGAL
jgi:hypothetical protein